MNQTTLTPPRPGSSPILTPEGIVCGTDEKYRWVIQPSQGRACTLFTMGENTISRQQVKGRASRDEVIHAFSVWVGGQSQPALRFHPPKQMELPAVRRILVWPDKNRIVLRQGLSRLLLQTDAAQLEPVLDYLSYHCFRASVTIYK